jgi:hypothetical protein
MMTFPAMLSFENPQSFLGNSHEFKMGTTKEKKYSELIKFKPRNIINFRPKKEL